MVICWQVEQVISTPANLQFCRVRSTASSANASSARTQSTASKEKFDFVKGVDYDFKIPKYKIILKAQPNIMNTTVESPGEYVLCKGHMLDKGIFYTSTYIKNVFPIIWVLILDARAKLRSLVFTQRGIGTSQALQTSNVTLFMVQLTSLSGVLGQPVELGLRCCKTGRMTEVSTTRTNVISLVCHNC